MLIMSGHVNNYNECKKLHGSNVWDGDISLHDMNHQGVNTDNSNAFKVRIR